MPSKKQSPIQIRISTSLKRKFESKCKENDKTITAVLKEFIETYVDDSDNDSEQEQESKTQDTLADADLQELKNEIHSLQSKVQSLEGKVQTHRTLIWDYMTDIAQLQKDVHNVPNRLQEHTTKLKQSTKQYIDKRLSELKEQMSDTSNNNTSLNVQDGDNDNYHA